jgi:DNA-binding NtrC family response regulator
MQAGSQTMRLPIPSAAAGMRTSLGALRGGSPQMNRVYRYIEKVAASDSVVLITGESGTGKELVARTIHALSRRRQQPFIAVNCGAIAPELVEAELFGYEKGSFTGALGRRAGYFEHAAGGTIFLDEVSEMAAAMQTRLLQVLETGTFTRVGGGEALRVEARIIAATHRDLSEAQSVGTFRRDLMHRLAVVPLHMPPLRERAGDAELLARHFLNEINEREKIRKTLSRRSIDALRAHAWPGNVRELRNAVQREWLLADRQIEITAASLAPRLRAQRARDGALSFAVGTPLAEMRREILLATLEQLGGDKRETARVLGVSLKTLYNRLQLYGDAKYVRRRAGGGAS